MNHGDESRLPVFGRRDVLQLLSGTALVGLAGGPAFAQGAPGGVLRVAANANPSSLDPATGGAGSDLVFLYTLYDTLVEWDYETLKAKPGLAQSWAFPDPTTMVLTLRDGVTFHDGTPCDAEAVRFNLERARKDPRSNIKADLVNVAAVEVSGPNSVTLRLSQPDTALPLILSDRAGMIASPKAIEAMGKDHDRNPVGSGPWAFASWADGERITVKRNPRYWKSGRPLLEGIEFQIIPDGSTSLRSAISGQTDVAYQLSERQRPLIEKSKALTLVSGPTLYAFQLYINYGRKPLNDVRVRQALNHAIDRKTFVEATMAGTGEPAYMCLPSAHWAFDKDVATLSAYDPDKAKKLLAEAGYADGLDLDLRGYNDQASVQRQEVLMEMFRKVGIRGRFVNGPIAEASGRFFGAEKQGDLLLSAWTGRPDPSQAYALMFLEGAYFNSGRAAPPAGFTEALAESRRSSDLAERTAALAKVQRIVMENVLAIPLAFRFDIIAASGKVQGFRSNLLGKPKFEDVSFKA
ncbi:ABC transporter substrate-binding protein [Azospirillum sp.]|uniref:ABC transporter substrate-binding protein n=1 Tax=Azospirillum sp. TaxID=34012 RepID=UPI002D6F4693|nr:ABC transporter substrate-binding protein [Azospirillum sp.]HYD71169.1 ABC transporter substrate-binding protein [Azospirillum sp.]